MNITLCTSALAAVLALSLTQEPKPPVQPTETASIAGWSEPPPIQAEAGGTLILNLGDGVERESLTAYDFVGACQQVTGLNFTWRDELTADLQGRSIRLVGAKVVPEARFYAFFELMMSANGFQVEQIGDPDISVVQITATRGR